ncbi:2OG-Fe(II) oxygenase [Allorhizobium sp. BGMRC 0089]|uniref:2OG-Fe(II) oxygenase family protein n=1 Tax=Allorhizobium sonneratiae TaxID=2934936 RepID=UPI002033E6C1|nr:2OG-Fe(II) oxygenase [Allorhizobium sonneratiae]MCM2291255.1 2OG-Fe(II) oxygenase [Allorhizobium sonneratiae]
MTACPIVHNAPIAPADPLPWIDITVTGFGDANVEQFGGLRTCFVFLPKLDDPRCTRLLERIGQLKQGLAASPAAENFAIMPVILEMREMELDVAKRWSPAMQIAVDTSRAFSRACGALDGQTARIIAVISDERLIVRHVITFRDEDQFIGALSGAAAADPQLYLPSVNRAPVMILKNVLTKQECRAFIDHWNSSNPRESGYMLKEADGKSFMMMDHNRKSRKDVLIEKNTAAYAAMWDRYERRIFVHLERFYHAKIVDVERFALARYAAAEGGKFRKHRDFDTRNRSREFAVTINLNEDFSGGELELPEFPGEKFKPAAGDAVVYAGTLMHEVSPVTSGDRYCLLAFLMTEKGRAFLDGYIEQHGATYETRFKQPKLAASA